MWNTLLTLSVCFFPAVCQLSCQTGATADTESDEGGGGVFLLSLTGFPQDGSNLQINFLAEHLYLTILLFSIFTVFSRRNGGCMINVRYLPWGRISRSVKKDASHGSHPYSYNTGYILRQTHVLKSCSIIYQLQSQTSDPSHPGPKFQKTLLWVLGQFWCLSFPLNGITKVMRIHHQGTMNVCINLESSASLLSSLIKRLDLTNDLCLSN